MVPEIKYHIGIVGCGKMGKDLFEFLRGFDFSLVLVCRNKDTTDEIQAAFEKNQKRLLRCKLISDEQYEFRLKQTTISSDLEQLGGCSLIIEAINEDIKLKKALFSQIEKLIPKDSIIVSNTSSISPDRLFKKMIYPKRCLGLHFFYPVKMKDVVEINMAENTSESYLEIVKDFLKGVGKYGLTLNDKDHFLVNRIFLKMQAGSCGLLKENKYSILEIDEQVKAGLFPLGIFEFFDHVGNDVMLQSVKNYMAYAPDPLIFQSLIETLEAKVVAGKLGKKTREGFYKYDGNAGKQESEKLEQKDVLLRQITNWYLEGVYEALESSVCTKSEIARVVKDYMMIEKNPFDLAEELGYTPK